MDGTSRTQKPHTSELLSSAKVVAGAAKAAAHHESDKIDKGKVAGAAADLLGAASHYGKMEEKGYGKYVQKAENYLDKHRSTTSTTTHSEDGGEAHSSGSHGGKYGDYVKMAEGILKHKKDDGAHADGGHHSGGDKYGDYIKMAEGLIKKH